MKHVTMAEKSFLVGDEVAEVLIQYAALLGKVGSADSVTIRSLGVDGELVEALFLLNSGTVMMAESTHSKVPEPDNSDALQYMRDQIDKYDSFSLPQDEPETGTPQEA